MKKRSIAIVALLIIMVVAVGGVLAYMTDEMQIKSTFTVGKVNIILTETLVDSQGNPVDKAGKPVTDSDKIVRKKEGNLYHLIPGMSYTKDPMVSVKKNSEDCYVRMFLTVKNKSAVEEIIAANNLSGYRDFFDGWTEDWVYHDFTVDEKNDTISFEFRYKEIVLVPKGPGKKDMNLEPLFTKLVIPGSVTTEQLAKLNGDSNANGIIDEGESPVEIIITAQAIQAAGFTPENTEGMTPEAIAKAAEDAAWIAFDAQMNTSADNSDQNTSEDNKNEDDNTGGDESSTESESGTGESESGNNKQLVKLKI